MEKEDILQEVRTMEQFDHHNVVSLLGISYDNYDSLMIVMPFMRNGSLRRYLMDNKNQLTRKQLLKFAMDVAQGMEYLSNKRFIHRDLAARNCLLDDQLVAKVSDFGLTRMLKIKNYYRIQNHHYLPRWWMAIESLDPNNKIFTTKSDVWSYGVLLWEIMSFGADPDDITLDQLNKGQRLQKPKGCLEDVYDLCLKCWSGKSTDRPDFTMILREMTEI